MPPAALTDVIEALHAILDLSTGPEESYSRSVSPSSAIDPDEVDIDGLSLENVQDVLDLFANVDLLDSKLGDEARRLYEDVAEGRTKGKRKGKGKARETGADQEAIQALKTLGDARIKHESALSPRSLHFAYSLMLRLSYLTRLAQRIVTDDLPITLLQTAINSLLPEPDQTLPLDRIKSRISKAQLRASASPLQDEACVRWARIVLSSDRLFVRRMEPPIGTTFSEGTRDEVEDMLAAREGMEGVLRGLQDGSITSIDDLPAATPVIWIARKILSIADRVMRDQKRLTELRERMGMQGVEEDTSDAGGRARSISQSLGAVPPEDEAEMARGRSSVGLEDLAVARIKEEQDEEAASQSDADPDITHTRPLFADVTSPASTRQTPAIQLTDAEIAMIARMRAEPGLWQSLPGGQIVKVEISVTPEQGAVGRNIMPKSAGGAATSRGVSRELSARPSMLTSQRQRVISAPQPMSARSSRPSMLPLPSVALSPPPVKHMAKRRRHTEGPAALEERTREKRAAEQAVLRGRAGNPVARELEHEDQADEQLSDGHDVSTSTVGQPYGRNIDFDQVRKRPRARHSLAAPAPVLSSATRITIERNRYVGTSTNISQFKSPQSNSKRFANFTDEDVVRFDKKPRRSTGRQDA